MNMDECDFQQMCEEHDLCYVWRCTNCGWQYEDRPGYNEAQPCRMCGGETVQIGESYTS